MLLSLSRIPSLSFSAWRKSILSRPNPKGTSSRQLLQKASPPPHTDCLKLAGTWVFILEPPLHGEDDGALERTSPRPSLGGSQGGWDRAEDTPQAHLISARTRERPGPKGPRGGTGALPGEFREGFLEEGTFTHQFLDPSARHTPQGRVNTDLWIA